MMDEGIGFTIGVPPSVLQARALVQKHRSALASPKRSFPFNGHVMRHVSDTWRVKGSKGRPRELDAHLFFEPASHAESALRTETAVFAIEQRAARENLVTRREACQWLSENARNLARCFSVHFDGERFRIQHKPRAVALAVARMGYTLILTSAKNVSGEDVLTAYRGRDRVEKLIDILKNDDGQYRLRTGKDNSVNGRLFVAFLALVLHGALDAKMRTAGLLSKMTVPQFFAKMRKVKSVRMSSGTRYLLEITKRNRELMAAVGIPLPQ